MPRSRLERRRRAAARWALYGSLGVIAATSALLVAALARPLGLRAGEAWAGGDLGGRREVRLLQEYARIDTSAAGSELAGAEFLAARLAAAGMAAQIERLARQRANLWAILEGDDPRALVLHHHIDVAPAGDLAAWDHPPFGAEIHLPWIYGRGVFDMKSLAVAHLEALLRLKARLDRAGRRPRRTVILLATSSEESGSRLGTRRILARHPDLVARFAAVLTEGGVVEAVSRREIKYWGIEFAQKRFAGGEACSPRRERLAELAADIAAVGRAAGGLRLVPEVDSFLASYAPSRDHPYLRRSLAEPFATLRDAPRFARLPAYLQALFRDEIIAFPVVEQPDGAGYRLPLVAHLLPGSELAPVLSRLLPAWVTQGVAVRFGEPAGAAHGSPADHPVLAALAAAVGERYPGARIGPHFLSWSATDARFFRAAGIPAYGFSPFLILPTDTLQVDAANERIGLPGFVEGVDFFAQVLSRLVD